MVNVEYFEGFGRTSPEAANSLSNNLQYSGFNRLHYNANTKTWYYAYRKKIYCVKFEFINGVYRCIIRL